MKFVEQRCTPAVRSTTASVRPGCVVRREVRVGAQVRRCGHGFCVLMLVCPGDACRHQVDVAPSRTNSCWSSRAGGGGDGRSLTSRCSACHRTRVQVCSYRLLRAKASSAPPPQQQHGHQHHHQQQQLQQLQQPQQPRPNENNLTFFMATREGGVPLAPVGAAHGAAWRGRQRHLRSLAAFCCALCQGCFGHLVSSLRWSCAAGC